ncbi:hypothetical protein INS49_015522 [Diaporthe citri]|uniref:uncharacterized protein n=1 Tax=Diaporthe citri TaxID=83186 RepID=UPI001C812778|nr:uncharacterized protein INS49_015522 [Diaporthe citri]KAG6356135.1 hypothetical protein INS49_015522 [Diaporthe citri]
MDGANKNCFCEGPRTRHVAFSSAKGNNAPNVRLFLNDYAEEASSSPEQQHTVITKTPAQHHHSSPTMASPPPLEGIKVLEFAGLAPGPFAGLLLADAGASVVRVDRPSPSGTPTADQLTRRKASVAVDLRTPEGKAAARRLALAAES